MPTVLLTPPPTCGKTLDSSHALCAQADGDPMVAEKISAVAIQKYRAPTGRKDKRITEVPRVTPPPKALQQANGILEPPRKRVETTSY